MQCEFCLIERKEHFLLNLPCGYLVCYEHIESISLASCCFMCQEHSLYQTACFDMKKNRAKLHKINYFKIKNLVSETCDKINSLKNDHQADIKSHFSSIINQIDLKRELLKSQFNDLIDKYYMQLMDKLENIETEFIEATKVNLAEVDIGQVREKLNELSNLDLTTDDSTFFKDETTILSDLFDQKLKEFVINFEKLNEIKLKESKNELNLNASNLFGTISNIKISTSKTDSWTLDDQTFDETIHKRSLIDETLNQSRKKFKSIGPVGMLKFLEISDEELVSISPIKPDSLIYLNRKNAEKSFSNFPGSNSSIEFILLFNKTIITINNNNSVIIWEDARLIKSFMCPKIKIILADFYDEKLFLIDKNYKISIRKYYNGEVYKTFNFGHATALKAMSENTIVTGHIDMIARWDTLTGEKLDSIKTNAEISCIERVNENQIAAGTSDGRICLWNLASTEIIKKQCHYSLVRFIQACPNGDILSISRIDPTVKVWNLDLKLMCNINLPGAYFSKILSDGKLAYINCHGEVFISED